LKRADERPSTSSTSNTCKRGAADTRERVSPIQDLTIRFKLWQTNTVIPVGILTPLCVALVVYEPGAYPMLLGPVLIACMLWYGSRVIRMEITPTVVRARQGRWHGQPDLEAPRAEICEIRYCPSRIIFTGTHSQSLMEPFPHWTLKQVLEVAELLDVPFYDHRGRFHLEELAVGRLVRGDSSADWWPLK
jgi:hypothetical protein